MFQCAILAFRRSYADKTPLDISNGCDSNEQEPCCCDRKQGIVRDGNIDCHKTREKTRCLSGETQKREDVIQNGAELQKGRYD